MQQPQPHAAGIPANRAQLHTRRLNRPAPRRSPLARYAGSGSLLTFPGPSRSFAIWPLYIASSLSSFLILTSIPPIRESVDEMASVSEGFGRALFVPKICG